jgi:adenosylhomocysteine nucleosidase
MNAIGILVALPDEGRTLLRQRLRFESLHGLPGGHWLAVSGAGPDAAHQHAELLIQKGVSGIVSWGCAAALHPDLNPGQLLLPHTIQGSDGKRHTVAQSWHQAVQRQLTPDHHPITEILVESRTVVAKGEDKRALHQDTGAHAVDMESAAVARIAEAMGLPFLVIRSVADPASLDFPPTLLAALNPRGDVKMSRLLGGLALKPKAIPELMALGRHFNQAMATLTDVRARLNDDFHFPHPTSNTP